VERTGHEAPSFVSGRYGPPFTTTLDRMVAGLALAFKSSAAERGAPTVSLLAQLFLHSGPWLLVVVIGAIYYVATLAEPAWLWAVLAGLGLVLALLAAAVSVAYWRRQRGVTTPVPLTPERLLKIRRRFFLGTSLYFGGGMAALMLYQMWPYFGQSVGLITMVVGICLGGGYVFSWFMWQWYGAALQAREDARRRAERNNAV
jgi:hypothetical protein